MSNQIQTNDVVCLYDKVRVKMADGLIKEFYIVLPDEADFVAGKISNESPVAQAALGAHTGEKKEYLVGGRKLEVEVLEIIKPQK